MNEHIFTYVVCIASAISVAYIVIGGVVGFILKLMADREIKMHTDGKMISSDSPADKQQEIKQV